MVQYVQIIVLYRTVYYYTVCIVILHVKMNINQFLNKLVYIYITQIIKKLIKWIKMANKRNCFTYSYTQTQHTIGLVLSRVGVLKIVLVLTKTSEVTKLHRWYGN